MYHKNGLFFAVNVLVVLILFAAIAPTTVSAQSDSAARVAIQGDAEEFGDVLLVKDGDNVIIYGLAGAVSTSGKVTVTADTIEPIIVNASFMGHFPSREKSPIIITDGANLESAQISFVKSGSLQTVTGTIPLNINSPDVKKALQDYSEELGKVMRGEKASIEKGTPPHILVDIVPETSATASSVGKVLLTQRLIVQGGGDNVTYNLVDQIEGISGAGLDPPIQSFPAFSKIGVYGVPVDVDNPNLQLRVYSIDTTGFVAGQFASNGYFYPFTIQNVNSSNVDEIKKGNVDSGISTPPVSDIFYLRITDGDNVFLATIANDITAAIEGDVTVVNNNAANAAGVDAIAILSGVADPYSVVTAYGGNDVESEWLASGEADGSGAFSISIPSTAPFNIDTNEFGVYASRTQVYLGLSDPFGNESSSLVEVLTDNELVVTESPVATPQPDGTMIVAGRTEAGAIILVDGRTKDGTEYYFSGAAKADADGAYAIISAIPYFDYKVTIVDQAGNSITTSAVADQTADAPSNLTATADFPYIVVTGTAEPYSSIITYGFDAGVVPENPVVSETLPLGAFYLGGSSLEFPETTAKADANGAFSLKVPHSVGRYIYLKAFDPAGNGSSYVPLELNDAEGDPLGEASVGFDSIAFINNISGVKDIITGRTINLTNNLPVSGVVVGIYRTTSQNAVGLPFVDQLAKPVAVNADGTFSLTIPDRSLDTNEFIEQFLLVAFTKAADGTLTDVGYILINKNDGLDRVGPSIGFTILASDIVLRQGGAGFPDMMDIRGILPSGSGSMKDIPADALAYVCVLADGNADGDIDVNSSSTYIVDFKPLNASIPGMALPIPGVSNLNLGYNYWNAKTQKVVGESEVFIAYIDAVGNFSPSPVRVKLDVEIADPDISKIAVNGSSIFAEEDAVEETNLKIGETTVSIFGSSDKTSLIATARAYINGGFAVVGLSIDQDYVYIVATDYAGNQSNVVKVKVTDPVKDTDFMVLDSFGVMHTSLNTLASAGDNARAISKVNETVYALLGDGSIVKVAGIGKLPKDSKIVKASAGSARDIEVISDDPFAAYVLFGNGLVISYGNATFFGDIGTPDASIPRVPIEEGSSIMFLDINNNGVRDTEDADGNGILDISVGLNGVLETEDTGIEGIAGSAGNGVLDEEQIFNMSQTDQGFGFDIARDLELVIGTDGAVTGYVIMDGLGVMWPYGSAVNNVNIRPQDTNGIAFSDQFRSFELILVDGQIVDFISLKGNGELFAMPSDQGGVLGAGPSTDATSSGFLSSDQYGITTFGFDIARDLEMCKTDSNGDGVIDYNDGFYVLDGLGGIHELGGAAAIEGAPFLGLDIAVDLEF